MDNHKKYTSHIDIIREFTKIYNEHGNTYYFSEVLEHFLGFISDELREIWKIIFTGIKYSDENKHIEAYTEFNKLNQVIKKDSLLFCFVMREKLYSYAFLDKKNVIKSIDGYDKLIEKFKDSRNLDIQLQVAKIKLWKGIIFEEQEKYDECLVIDDIIIKEHQEKKLESFVVVVINAIRNKAISLRKLGKNEESVNQYRIILENYKKYKNSIFLGL
jgi:tetratricopeptide (TPR) repeat protein